MKPLLRSLVPCFALLLAAPNLHAITATVYENIPDAGNSADPANFASTLANANFTIGAAGINFQISDSTVSSVATFLNNPTFTNAVNSFNPNNVANNSELVITGTTYLNAGANSFVVAHDDGVDVTFPGIGAGTFGNILTASGPTSEAFTPFNVTAPSAGLYAFTVDYSECCGGPADLVFTVNSAPVGTPTPSAVPEPSSFVMLGSGLLAAANIVRRRFVA